jgi:putative oxidoreductase
MRFLLSSSPTLSATVLRLGLAAAIFPHGAQKAFGWFGGPGFSGQVQYFTETAGLPTAVAVLVILIEVLAPLALVLGLLTRLAALGVGAVMVGAVATVHWQNGFFMNWSGQKAGEGFEYHILALSIALALLIAGGGRLSLDRRLSKPKPAGR